MLGIIPFDKILVHLLSFLAGLDRLPLIRIRTQIVGFSLKSNLRNPLALPAVQINPGMTAGAISV